jgi:hypothetical protein
MQHTADIMAYQMGGGCSLSSGFTKAQVRACFAPDTVPDDWIEEVFRGVEGGRLGLEAFAIMMEQALSRRSEPLGDLKLYFQP